MYKIILIVWKYSDLSHFGILGAPGPSPLWRGIPRTRKLQGLQVGNSAPTLIFDFFKIICIRNSQYILLSLVQNSYISASFLILSDIDGLLQGSLAHYMFLNLISQLLKLNPWKNNTFKFPGIWHLLSQIDNDKCDKWSLARSRLSTVGTLETDV